MPNPPDSTEINPLDPIVAEADNATLDRVLRAAPSMIRADDLAALVPTLRRDRARFINLELRREEKKEGIDLTLPESPEEAIG